MQIKQNIGQYEFRYETGSETIFSEGLSNLFPINNTRRGVVIRKPV